MTRTLAVEWTTHEVRVNAIAPTHAGGRCHAEAGNQSKLGGWLEITQSAVSKLEHADDVRVSTLRQYLDALRARLELVAVFADDDCRVPIHLGRDDAA